MKYIFLVLAINLFVQCASVNLIREPTTARDKEQVSNLTELAKTGMKIRNKLAILSTKSSLQNLKQYDDIIRSSTVQMVDSLGGVEVIVPREIATLRKENEFLDRVQAKDLADNQRINGEGKLIREEKNEFYIESKAKEAQLNQQLGLENSLDEASLKTKYSNGQLNQKLGTESGVDELFLTDEGMLSVAKYLPPIFVQIRSQLTNASYNVVYNPPVTYTDSKTKETKTTSPSWTMTVSVEIRFTAMSSKGKDLYSNTLTNTYSKTFPENPPPSMANIFLPKAIAYCFEDVKPDLQGIFSLKTHIIALKGDKKYAMIYGGTNNKIRNGRVFDVLYKNNEVATLKIFLTNHSNAWGKLSGDVDKVKKGSEVVLRAEKRSIFAIIWRFIESKFGL